MSDDSKPEPMSYIGRANCGCIRFACVDEPEFTKKLTKDIARILKEGGTIERVTCEFVRQNMRRCPHKEKTA